MEWNEINIKNCPVCKSSWKKGPYDWRTGKMTVNCSNFACDMLLETIRHEKATLSRYVPCVLRAKYCVEWDIANKITTIYCYTSGKKVKFPLVLPFNATANRLKTYILFS